VSNLRFEREAERLERGFGEQDELTSVVTPIPCAPQDSSSSMPRKESGLNDPCWTMAYPLLSPTVHAPMWPIELSMRTGVLWFLYFVFRCSLVPLLSLSQFLSIFCLLAAAAAVGRAERVEAHRKETKKGSRPAGACVSGGLRFFWCCVRAS
jgi:hypothetical protein